MLGVIVSNSLVQYDINGIQGLTQRYRLMESLLL